MSVPMGDGATRRVHLERLRNSTGRVDPELAEVQTPVHDCVAPLWATFSQLSSTRQASADGVQPITCQEIESWQRLQRVQLTPWEVDCILQMDRAARSVPMKAPSQ